MTYDEKVAGIALLNEVAQALNNARFDESSDVVRVTLAVERLAQFFGSGIRMAPR